MAKPICQPLILGGLQSENKNPAPFLEVGNIKIHVFLIISETKYIYFENQKPAAAFWSLSKL